MKSCKESSDTKFIENMINSKILMSTVCGNLLLSTYTWGV